MTKEYMQLWNVIDSNGFRYGADYAQQEKELLQPQLEKKGYYNIEWSDGERDSFGPLTRVCKATAPNGEVCWFMYG